MEQQIQEVQAQGFKPVVFIEKSLIHLLKGDHELMMLSRAARRLNVTVFNDDDIAKLNRMHKAYVFRYGTIPLDTEAKVKRKGGKIISGNLKVQ